MGGYLRLLGVDVKYLLTEDEHDALLNRVDSLEEQRDALLGGMRKLININKEFKAACIRKGFELTEFDKGQDHMTYFLEKVIDDAQIE